jgi:hypothetical protein
MVKYSVVLTNVKTAELKTISNWCDEQEVSYIGFPQTPAIKKVKGTKNLEDGGV